jgi:hypothetical protein
MWGVVPISLALWWWATGVPADKLGVAESEDPRYVIPRRPRAPGLDQSAD